MKTHAAVLSRAGLPRPYAVSRPLAVEELDLAEPGPGEALVRIASVGLCHSDLARIEGTRPRPMPMVLGHEAAGVVEAVGPDVSRVKPGDKVVFTFVPMCGECAYCVQGRPALCQRGIAANSHGTLLRGSTRFSLRGERVYHHSGVSGFSERTVAAQESLVPVPGDTPLDIAAVFGCAAITGIGAVLNAARVEPSSSIAIFGAGGVGLMAVLGSVVAQAETVIVVDPIAKKRQVALSLGATHVIDPKKDDAAAAVRDIVSGGADVTIEAVGLSATLEQAYAATARGGKTVAVGLASMDVRAEIAQNRLVADERTLVGSYMGSSVPLRDIPRYIKLWRTGRLPVERLVSGTFALDDINDALDELVAGEVMRTVCRFQ